MKKFRVHTVTTTLSILQQIPTIDKMAMAKNI
jgi:hypothetical protein